MFVTILLSHTSGAPLPSFHEPLFHRRSELSSLRISLSFARTLPGYRRLGPALNKYNKDRILLSLVISLRSPRRSEHREEANAECPETMVVSLIQKSQLTLQFDFKSEGDPQPDVTHNHFAAENTLPCQMLKTF
jgi:hypothetical protein